MEMSGNFTLSGEWSPCVPFTERANTIVPMCRLTGGDPPLQQVACSSRFAVILCTLSGRAFVVSVVNQAGHLFRVFLQKVKHSKCWFV